MKQPGKDTLTPKLKQVLRDSKKFLSSKLPVIIKREGLDFIAGNFDAEGFRPKEGSVQKWKERKPTDNDRAGRSLLVDKGHLRRSWELDTSHSASQVIFQNVRPYAEVHNEGGHAGRGRGFTMPQRQMIGPSELMASMIENKVTREMKKIIT
jgi:phage gpG-like protein